MQGKSSGCDCEDWACQCRCLPAERCPECGFAVCACEAFEDNAYQRMQAAMARLDLVDCVIMAHEHAADKAEDSPLLHLAESFAINPPMDWERPAISPLQAQGIGYWMAIQLSRIIGRRLEVLASNATF